MSNLYNSANVITLESVANSNSFMEMLLVDDILRGSDEQRKSFCESAEAQVLVEKAVLKKPTLIRLGKEADNARRVKLAVYTLAKEANDPEYTKLLKFTKARKICIAKLVKKYGTKAQKIANISQKKYIKIAQSGATTTTDKAEDKK